MQKKLKYSNSEAKNLAKFVALTDPQLQFLYVNLTASLLFLIGAVYLTPALLLSEKQFITMP